MPWQQLVADVGLEVDENGVPYYREVWLTVPRQSGKTTLVLVWELDRALNWGEPQRILYSAQNGAEAARKLITDQAPLLQRSPLSGFVQHVYRANGVEAVAFDNGSRIDILRDAESAGHGKTLDLAVMDEAFADTDERREQAVIPAMSTRRKAQILGLSTAGTDMSTLLIRKRDLGRQAVAEDWDSRIAYFEWAAPEDADPDDESVWWSCMPALGRTVDLEVIRHARKTMKEGDFRRAFLNQWTSADDRVIPLDVWEAACRFETADCAYVALDVVDTPSLRASVAVADSNGVAQVHDNLQGKAWAVKEAIRLAEKYGCPVALDPARAGSVVKELEDAGVTVVALSSADMANACASFVDAAFEGTLQLARDYALDEAIAGATRRPSGERWYWDRRRSTTDISPLVAVTIARYMALTAPEPVFSFYIPS